MRDIFCLLIPLPVSVISIIISSVGLFALVSFVTEQRTKEIGLRKVNGATSGNIIMMLFSTFMKFEIVAFLFA